MKAALHKKRPNYTGTLNFMARADKDTTKEEVGGLLKWASRLRLGCTKKQLPAAAKVLRWIERMAPEFFGQINSERLNDPSPGFAKKGSFK